MWVTSSEVLGGRQSAGYFVVVVVWGLGGGFGGGRDARVQTD